MRPSWDEYFLNLSSIIATRGTCPRKQVGCILVDARNNIIGTGYNGNAPGEDHCIEIPCEHASAPRGSGLNKCPAVHAEVNALMRCSNVYAVATAYVSWSPCDDCVKLLLTSSCQRIVFLNEYPHFAARDRWLKSGRAWVHHKE